MLSYSKGTTNSLARKAYYFVEKESRVISIQEGRIRKSTSCSIILLYKILAYDQVIGQYFMRLVG